jgi:purine-binding chemotaxis protein CheW
MPTDLVKIGTKDVSAGAKLLATFLLGGAAFGIDAQLVEEVVKVGEITKVSHAPPCVVGIRNLRGRIVTVIDLRALLTLGAVPASGENRILIVDSRGEQLGLLVDSVADTISANAEDVAPPPSNLHGVQGRNLHGVCRGGGRLVALLNLNSLLQAEEQEGATTSSRRA